MIKRIKLKNFESHEDSTIEFSNGLNLIVGQSNQGKSSIVRALAVCLGRFDKDEVRTGASFCSVTVETERGSVTVERGEDTNHWVIDTPSGKKEYRNIGLTVPPEVLVVLGMGERVRGEMKELPNIMFQLEKHYMLSEIDGKKATSNIIARMMDEAIGLGGLEELIRDIASDFASKKKDLGTKNIQISELRGQILDISIFEEYKKSLESARKSLCEVESLEELLESAKVLSLGLEKNKFRLEQVNSSLAVSDGLEELSDDLSYSAGKLALLQKAYKNVQERENIGCRINSYMGLEILEETASREVEKCKLLKEALLIESRLNNLNLKIDSNVSFGSEVSDIQIRQGSIERAELMLSEAREVYKKIRSISNRFISEENKLKIAESRFEELKTELGACPLCGGEL